MLKKAICILAVALTVTTPATAQFKGFGKALLDKAKDEVEDALSDGSDGAENKAPATSKKQAAAPADAGSPSTGAPYKCYQVSNVDGFSNDVTRFKYCNQDKSVLDLSAPQIAGAPAFFQDRGAIRDGMTAEIRLPGETVLASPLDNWGEDPRGGQHHNLVISSPAVAVKVARAINAAQPFEIVLKGPAGEAFTAFSGTFDLKFPPDLIGGGASKAAAQNKNAAPVAQSSPQSGQVAFADPLGKACARDSALSGLYDCGCVAEKAVSVREEIADKRFAQQQKYIPRRTAQLEAARKQLAEATSESQRKSAQNAVDRAEKTLADLKVRPDPASIEESNVAQYAYQGSSCKTGDYIRENERKNCLASPSLLSGGTDPNAFCACSADKVATAWLTSDQAYGSKFQVQATTQARSACRP